MRLKLSPAVRAAIEQADRAGLIVQRGKPAAAKTALRPRGKAKADAADRIIAWCRDAGLPEPIREVLVAPGERRWRFDLAWPSLMLAVEIEGGAFAGKPCDACGQRAGGRHNRGVGMRNDIEKYAEALCRGWVVLRIMPEQIRNGVALRWIERIMTRKS